MYNWNKVPRPEMVHYWNIRFDLIISNILELESYNKFMEDYITNSKNLDDFGNTFRSSFLVQILALIEYEMKQICLLIENYNFQLFSINDLKGGSDMEKAKVYLTKTIELDFNLLNPEWKFIRDCFEVRNKIIHSQGTFDDNKTINEFAKTNKSIIITQKTHIMRPKRKIIYSFTINDSVLNSKLISDSKIMFKKINNYFEQINSLT